MFRLTKNPTRALALLIPPVALVLAYVSISRSSGPSLPRANPETSSKRSELGPNVDLDHDGLPDNLELRTFNDRESFRRWFTWVAEMQFYNLSDQRNPDKRWRPIITNPNFLGFYRLKILNQQVTPEE